MLSWLQWTRDYSELLSVKFKEEDEEYTRDLCTLKIRRPQLMP